LVGRRDHRTQFWKGAIQGQFHKVWLQLAQWFLRRRFLCEFPIGSYGKLSSAVGAILVEAPNIRTHFWKRTIQWLFRQNLVLIEQLVPDKKIFMWISQRVLWLWEPSWSKGRTAGHISGREPSNDYFIKIYFLLSKWFQTRIFLWEFPIGSYVKLSLAAAAILVGGLKCQTQFWKRTTQGSFQQSLVEIGSVVSEEKIL
jgi:hypothetical protein